MAACVFDGRIWALGGYCHKRGAVLDDVETFEEDIGRWVRGFEVFPDIYNGALGTHLRGYPPVFLFPF